MKKEKPENKGDTPETAQTAHYEKEPVALVPETPEQKAEREGKEEQERTTLAKERFLESFAETVGIVELACKRANIGRRTYYTWIKEDPVFKDACDKILEEQLDYVEGIFLTSIHAGNIKSVHFYLDRKHPGYVKRIITKGETRTAEDLLDEIEAMPEPGEKTNKGHEENKPGTNANASDTDEARAGSAIPTE